MERARHPTLLGRLGADCIPNDVEIGTDEQPGRMVLLTGPNMGGMLFEVLFLF